MYRRIGDFVSRFPVPSIGFWVAVALLAITMSPKFVDVWQDGELAFLPAHAPSQLADKTFRTAFPTSRNERVNDESFGTSVQQDPLGSSIVIVLVRENKSGLTEEDISFISDTLLPKLNEIRHKSPQGYELTPLPEATEVPLSEQVIRGISTLADRRIGPLLQSPDQRATLIVVELTTEFLDRKNALVLNRVEEMLNSAEIQRQKPLGLALALSGSATVGRDILRAESLSASRTETFTKVLVVILLLMIYRAPLLALVPLVTVGVAVELTLALLRHLAGLGWIGLFTGLEVYVTVVVYGAGVDYCLFLIARYKEELDHGADYRQAISMSIQRVGVALATSAGTSICGIAMMGFANFGKFRQAGFAISFGLFVVLCFAMTFTPAFLLLLGKYAFWPDIRSEQVSTKSSWMRTPNLWKTISDQRWLEAAWEYIARRIKKRPIHIFLGTTALMMPFAVIGVMFQSNLSYGLLSDLPQNEPSVSGAKVVQDHFPGGVTGPITMLLEFEQAPLKDYLEGDDFTALRPAEKFSEALTESLEEMKKRPASDEVAGPLKFVDLRNQTYPLGQTKPALDYIARLRGIGPRNAKRTFAHKTYTSLQGDLAGRVMRLDLVFEDDPFSRKAIADLSVVETRVVAALPKELQSHVKVHSLGPTAGIRDLKDSTDIDRIRIYVLVVVAVYVVLIILLRQPSICAYLMVTVVFSYLVSLGITFVVFYLRDPANFSGLDWKVPVYLFTILIAMGQDYNILLMERVWEEQRKHGKIGGILIALTRTGSIISSCGLIMAGTFASLMTGTLLGMVQLGFALAIGVLLDTFIVRPILVPSYLVLLHSGRFGWLGKWLGDYDEATDTATVRRVSES